MKYALLVGCNYKDSQYPLRGCIADVQETEVLLRERYGYSNVEVLTDDVSVSNVDHLASKSNVLRFLERLANEAKHGDTVYFHFSGHGGQSVDLTKDERDHKDEEMYMMHLRPLKDDEFKSLFINRLAKGVRLRCVIDACHSGTMIDAPYLLQTNGLKVAKYATEAPEFQGTDDVIEISGCRDNQTSADTVDREGDPCGALTWALREVLCSSEDLSFKDVLLRTRRSLQLNGYTQVPQLSLGRRNLERLIVDF
jgi:metacaspase-1